jgi:transcriptional regulator with XRE-family HTH domain
MDIKVKLDKILKKENYSFSALAAYLQITEDELEFGLINKTLEIRHFEAISKILRVPLYSFFSEYETRNLFGTKPYYVNRLCTSSEAINNISLLELEILQLKHILSLKEERLCMYSN